VIDARAQSAVADLQRATDALTLSRQRYLGRLVEPRWAVVPGLLAQLADAVIRSGEVGAVSTSNPSRAPLDLGPIDLLTEIQTGTRIKCARAGLCARPGPTQVAVISGDLRQLTAHARTLAATEYPAVAGLVDLVVGWRDRITALLPEIRTSRDLPDLTCARCKRRRVPELAGDGRRLLVPALRYVATPMPGVQCRGCGHLYQGDTALRALAAWQRAGAA
jgi:hypothetical protein